MRAPRGHDLRVLLTWPITGDRASLQAENPSGLQWEAAGSEDDALMVSAMGRP